MEDQPTPLSQTEPQPATPATPHSKTPLIILSTVAAFSLVANAVLGYMVYMSMPKSVSTTNITTFDDCVAAGNPIMESYPEQCMTPDGKSFTNTSQASLTQVKQDDFPFTRITNPNYLEELLSMRMDYPADLELYEHQNRDAYGNENMRDVIVYLCHPPLGEPNLDRHSDICPNGFIKIAMNGDGWGGGCDPENSGNIPFSGEEKPACVYENSFNLLSHKHGEAQYLFSGVYSSDFPQGTVMDILSTIEFTKNYQQANTTSWQTYADKNYSFIYPSNWAQENSTIQSPEKTISIWLADIDSGGLMGECIEEVKVETLENFTVRHFIGTYSGDMCEGYWDEPSTEKWIVRNDDIYDGISYSYSDNPESAEEVFERIKNSFTFNN